jgi:hypothetical protein
MAAKPSTAILIALTLAAFGSARAGELTVAEISNQINVSRRALPAFKAECTEVVTFPGGGEKPDPPLQESWGNHAGRRTYRALYKAGLIKFSSDALYGVHRPDAPLFRQTEIVGLDRVSTYTDDMLQGGIVGLDKVRHTQDVAPLDGYRYDGRWIDELLSNASKATVSAQNGQIAVMIEHGGRVRLVLDPDRGYQAKEITLLGDDGNPVLTTRVIEWTDLGGTSLPGTIERVGRLRDGPVGATMVDRTTCDDLELANLEASSFEPKWPEGGRIKDDRTGLVWRVLGGKLVEDPLFPQHASNRDTYRGWAVMGGSAAILVLIGSWWWRKRPPRT